MIKDYGYTPDRDTVAIELPHYKGVLSDEPVPVANELTLRIQINNLSDTGLDIKREENGEESITGHTERRK